MVDEGYAIKSGEGLYLRTAPFYDYINHEYVEANWQEEVPSPMPKWYCERQLERVDGSLVKVREYLIREEF